jgi:hypothetical protein
MRPSSVLQVNIKGHDSRLLFVAKVDTQNTAKPSRNCEEFWTAFENSCNFL